MQPYPEDPLAINVSPSVSSDYPKVALFLSLFNIVKNSIASITLNELCLFVLHQEALEDLEELKQIVPTESLVYFLIGKVSIIGLNSLPND